MADNKPTQGAADTSSTSHENEEETTGTGKQPTSGDPSTKPTDESGDKTISQKQLERILKDRLAQERKAWEIEAQRAAQEAETERNRLAQEQTGEYKLLYEQTKAETASLKTQLQERERELETLRGLVEKQIEDAIKDWPVEVLETDPKTDNPGGYTLAQRQAWYNRSIRLAAKLMDVEHNPGNRGGPKEDNTGASSADVQEYVNRRSASGFSA